MGYSNEQLYLFVAEGLVPGETCFDENEAIDIEEIDIDILFDMVMTGRIHDAKTIIAILMIRDMISSGKLRSCRRL